MKEFVLENGVILPSVGYGTWKLKNNVETVSIIDNAIDIGYRLIDTAVAYGNYEMVGKAIKNSKVKREELFISGKVWNDSRKYNQVIADNSES